MKLIKLMARVTLAVPATILVTALERINPDPFTDIPDAMLVSILGDGDDSLAERYLHGTRSITTFTEREQDVIFEHIVASLAQ